MSINKNKWKCLYDSNKNKVYEGFTKNNKPCGAGTSYFPDGRIYQEGIFGIKGLLCGREYYPNGKLRFEGVYKLNRSYGPNYPKYGLFQSNDGCTRYEGLFTLKFGGVGYPVVEVPRDFGSVVQIKLDIPVLMWEDE